MSHMSKIVFVIGVLCAAPAVTFAGWVAEWEHTPIKSDGERGTTEVATMRIAKNKVRLAQPHTTSLIDYEKSRFTILNPDRQYFWSGTVDQYVAEMVKTRARAAKRRGSEETEPEMPRLDRKSLPPVTITKTDETTIIAGHETNKHEIRVKDELVEEIWIAEDLDLSADMDAKKVLDYQKKMSAAMLGNSAITYNALYYSPEYSKLMEKGFVLRSVTRHIAGGFERKATELKRMEIPDGEFKVPDGYRKVRLSDVFATDQAS